MTMKARRRVSSSGNFWRDFRFGIFLVLALAAMVWIAVNGYLESYGYMDSIMDDILSDK